MQVNIGNEAKKSGLRVSELDPFYNYCKNEINLDILGFNDAELMPMLDSNTVSDFSSEWEGMPEYSSEDLSAYRTIRVHFNTDEDVEAFAKKVGQDITEKTKFIYFPEETSFDAESKRYD